VSSGLHDPLPHHRLSLVGIIEATAKIDPTFLATPQYEATDLSEVLGCRVVVKVETDNPIGCFKGRGADYYVRRIVERGDNRLLVCASTGNFGQAMAYVCRSRGRRVVVYADQKANPLKLGRIVDLGGDVRLAGDDFDAAKTAARAFSRQTGALMVEDGREPEISEGAGTIAVELLQHHKIDVLLVPLGDGALLNGMGRWTRAASPDTRVIGVAARGADAMAASFRKGRAVARHRAMTIAEGIAVRVPVSESVADMMRLVDAVLVVDDEEMIAAMRLIRDKTGELVEPSGAVGIAASMADPSSFAGQTVATVFTGKNLSREQTERWLG
jgi:threonine dehydratase